MRTIWALRGGRLTATPFSLRTQLKNTLDQARHADWPAKHVPNLPAWQKTCAAQPFHCAVVCTGWRRRRASFELHAGGRHFPGQAGIPDSLQTFGLAKQPPVGPWVLPAGRRRRPFRPRGLSRRRGTCHGCLHTQPGREVALRANLVARRRTAHRGYSRAAEMFILATCTRQHAQSRGGRLTCLALVGFCFGSLQKRRVRVAFITRTWSAWGGGRLTPESLNGTRCATTCVDELVACNFFR